eukprot:1137326-Amorphochlora_amoeboformis.AAC.1
MAELSSLPSRCTKGSPTPLLSETLTQTKPNLLSIANLLLNLDTLIKAARKNKEKIGGGFGEKFRHFSTDANGPDPGAMSSVF